ncbi:OPA3 family protein [Aspergillus clavatus NRRL 1]|uniref:OPA3 domain protein n=1 Tax=Aspergillus clavatus (strain ATCC 1007 / CBS 513.65 / DSM 816 / NCTC 3887 / NRRL 1 / QM 1276 / 107) TaxID=344612 RepID=A1C4A7_ASPCL|nr:OPA3 domain protein [Aspergillus clavatus NRRL 1]EAW15247.1 OPA3 domain protein [Aspergillus clavatus NRRL 1]
MSLTLKLSSLVIRTLSKPIANQIKGQAREHERFRKFCISIAQGLHRVDMRLRLGSLRDSATAQRRAAAEAELRKHKPTTPTVKTEAETKAEEQAIAKAKAVVTETAKPAPAPHIRPLSESKAIESGATFISETFLFLVAGGLIVFESWRSRRKENTRREDVEARLVELEQSEKAARRALIALEKEVLHLKAKAGESVKSHARILPREVWEVEQGEAEDLQDQDWWSRITSYLPFMSNPVQDSAVESQSAISTASGSPPKTSTPEQSSVSPVKSGH